jgi:hypothetical protein
MCDCEQEPNFDFGVDVLFSFYTAPEVNIFFYHKIVGNMRLFAIFILVTYRSIKITILTIGLKNI